MKERGGQWNHLVEVDRERDWRMRWMGRGVSREEGNEHASAHDNLHDFVCRSVGVTKSEGIIFFFFD